MYWKLSICLSLLIISPFANAQIPFDGPLLVPVWDYQMQVTDLDRDGHLDLIPSSDPFNAAYGRGDGTFDQKTLPDYRDRYYGSVIGDWNGDGLDDLLCPNYGSYTVFWNRGKRRFEEGAIVSFPHDISKYHVADFNRDGLSDLLLGYTERMPGNYFIYRHALILSQGDGAFVEAWNINIGREIYEGIEGIADFNHDGYWDMLVQRNGFSIRFIQPDGALSDYHNVIALESYGDAAIGDWDGDGFPDVVVSDDNWRVIFLRNRGDGAFEMKGTLHLAEQKIFGESEWRKLLGAVDIDGDGRDELAIVHENWLKFLRYRENHLEKAFPIYGRVHQIFAGDFTEDGLPDILLNQGLYPAYAPGKFRAPTRIPLERTYIDALLASDFDGDGLADVLASVWASEIQFLKGHGDGTFDAPIHYPLTWEIIRDSQNLYRSYELQQADFDEDGHPDILLTGAFIFSCVSSNIYILLTGKSWRTVSIETGLVCPDATATDFNGDGHIDLAIANRRHWISPNLEGPKPIQLWLGQGDATFRKGATIIPEFQGRLQGVDLDQDGATDLIAVDSQGLFWLRGRGEGNTSSAKAEDVNGTFESPVRILDAPPPDDIYVADLDNNSLPDIIGRYEYARELVVWMQYAPGQFWRSQKLFTEGNTASVAIADVNVDGWLDLAAGGLAVSYWEAPPLLSPPRNDDGDTFGGLNIFLGRGDGTFETLPTLASLNPHSVAFGDFNGDGLLDLAHTEYEGLWIWFNNGERLKPSQKHIVGGKLFTSWSAVKHVQLLANYPNPANPETCIPYRLVDTSEAVLEIHDIAGRLIRRWKLDGISPNQWCHKHWNGRNEQEEQVASGVYFYTLRTGQASITRTLVIRYCNSKEIR